MLLVILYRIKLYAQINIYKKIIIIKKIFFQTHKKFFLLLKHIVMVNLTTYKLSLIAEKWGIKNYKNMSREKLLSTLDESERNFKNISQNGLEWIAKMQNLSQNELEQITKMWNLSQNELEQIAKMRRIKNFKNIQRKNYQFLF